ncbi:GAK8 protein, partial [Poecile atricapillus]|nr:GAK8 protein [Poecile atricapillus]
MERQAAYDLLTCFLEKQQFKGFDLRNELPGFLAYGYAQGCFQNPHTVHELSEWRKFGDKLWEDVLNDDKTAKKLRKLLRTIYNAHLQYQAEQAAATQASAAMSKNRLLEGVSECPLPPAMNTVILAPPATATNLFVTSPTPLPTNLDSGPPPPSLMGNESVYGVESDLGEAIARERRVTWAALAWNAMQEGDQKTADTILEVACPVTFTPLQGGGMQAQITALDWKWLAQLQSTVSQFGVTSEPVRQMIDYLWGTQILLPADCRSIMKLILSQYQQLLFNAHWQAYCQESVNVQRQIGDPLHGLTLEELMGLGAYSRVEAQAILGPDKLREGMRLVRAAFDRIKEPGGIPSYMGIKQGRDEPFGASIGKAAAAIERAGVPEYMRGALLKQCALQNCNPATRSVLNTLNANWSIEEALERLSNIPVGSQAMLVQAIKELGQGLEKQAAATQSQVLAALAHLQAATINNGRIPASRLKCFHCGNLGHIQKECSVTSVWCNQCRSNTCADSACCRRSGNRKASAKSRRAMTQIAAARTSVQLPSSLPQQGASAWTWQPQ